MMALEPAAGEFARAAAQPPHLHDNTPAAARRILEEIQAGPCAKPRTDNSWITVDDEVRVRVRIMRPHHRAGVLPAILYLHGGGWILGSAATHDRLAREIAVGADAAVVFVEYDRSPEARYPVALCQAHAAARWIQREGPAAGLDPARVAVAGDSAGGNLAAALTLLAKQRGDVSFVHQSLYYPVTSAAQDTHSYREFAQGPHLTAETMRWFWDAYLPERESREEITASPLNATADELHGLPETFVLVDESDVLRDEGEAYAAHLNAAGVRCASVRYNCTLHDFMMLNPLRETAAADAAITQAAHQLHRALHTEHETRPQQ